jgi:hypothetical protein
LHLTTSLRSAFSSKRGSRPSALGRIATRLS